MMSAIIAKSRDGFPRRALGAPVAFLALNAFGGGLYGVLGAVDVVRIFRTRGRVCSYYPP